MPHVMNTDPILACHSLIIREPLQFMHWRTYRVQGYAHDVLLAIEHSLIQFVIEIIVIVYTIETLRKPWDQL